MSLFFNFQVDGDKDEETRFEIDELLPSGTVVDDQSGYMVGINRFKLPISNVPMFRLYADEYQFGVGFRGGIAYDGHTGGSIVHKVIAHGTDLIFGGNAIPTTGSYGKYGYDSLFREAPNDNRKRYVDIDSHEEFTYLLNNAFAKGFSKAVGEVNTNQNGTLNLPSVGPVVCGAGAAGDGITPMGTATLANIASVNGGFAGAVVSGVTLTINSITSATAFVITLHTGYFTVGETVTGGTSGATVTIVSLSDDTTLTWLSENAPNSILYASLVEAYTFMKGETDMLQLYIARYAESIQRLQNYAQGIENRDAYREGLVRASKT